MRKDISNQTTHYLTTTIISLVFFCLLPACNRKKPVKPIPAFYHWQTRFQTGPLASALMTDLVVRKLYIKCFDVDWDFQKKEPVALATLEPMTNLSGKVEFIPAIFITNRTLINISEQDIPDLALKISRKLDQQLQAFSRQTIREIQFDCDWTRLTRAKYFHFLETMKSYYNIKGISLSATIRLHQIKYPDDTGVPPVKRGMLMYYNMGKVEELNTINSILDNQVGKKYLSKLRQYNLPLDVALPLYQWGVLFRNGKMIKLINQLSKKDLEDPSRFVKKGHYWEVRKSTYLKGYYLYKSDLIRLERSELPQLILAADLLSRQLKKENRSIAFYHLDESVLGNFREKDLQEIIDAFATENEID